MVHRRVIDGEERKFGVIPEYRQELVLFSKIDPHPIAVIESTTRPDDRIAGDLDLRANVAVTVPEAEAAVRALHGLSNELAGLVEYPPLQKFAEPALANLKTVTNESYREGMFTSLQAGLNECRGSSRVLYHFTDQPDIPVKFYRGFAAQAFEGFNWVQPVYKGQKGHPVLIGKELFGPVLSAPRGSNLRVLKKSLNINECLWDCPYRQVLNNVNTPEDFSRLESGRE